MVGSVSLCCRKGACKGYSIGSGKIIDYHNICISTSARGLFHAIPNLFTPRIVTSTRCVILTTRTTRHSNGRPASNPKPTESACDCQTCDKGCHTCDVACHKLWEETGQTKQALSDSISEDIDPAESVTSWYAIAMQQKSTPPDGGDLHREPVLLHSSS